MRAIKYRELKRMYDASGPQQTVKHLQEALVDGHLKPEDFSIRELAEVFSGGDCVRAMDPRENKEPDTDKLKDVSGVVQCLVYTVMMKAATQEAFVVSKLVDTAHAEIPFDDETPQTTKRGFDVLVTKEAIFFDRTHLILQRAADVGEVLGLNKEKRLIDVVVGISNDYTLDGRGCNTYSSTGTPPDGDWINELDDNEPVHCEQLDYAEQLFASLHSSDPPPRPTAMLVMPAYAHAVRHMFHRADGVYGYKIVESRLAYRRIVATGAADGADAKKWWFIGDFKKAFAYMENWPITVVQASNHPDCVLRFKASERGAAAVTNPRYVVKSTGADGGG